MLSKYGVARHIYIPIVKRAVVDFAVGADWTPAAGDVKISKDGGTAANVTNLPTAIAMGNGAIWDFSLTATEMQAAQIDVTIVDSATKAIEDQSFIIETYGNASAQHPVDLADSVRAGLTALPNATVGASGGLPTLDAALNVSSLAVDSGTAQAGAAATITLRAGASATDNLFVSAIIAIYSGTGAGQCQVITGYVGSTKVATVARTWAITPDNTSVYKVHGLPSPRINDNLAIILQTGTGTGQLDFTSGVVKANLVQILATALTETAGQIAAAFKKFFDKATPTGTINSIPDAVAGASGGLFIAGANAATTVNITGNLTGNVSGSVGSIAGVTFPSNFSLLSIDSNGRVKIQALNKNVARAGFQFPMTDSTTHAPKTGVTVTAQRSINGATFAACTNSPTEIASGAYTIDLSAADLNGDFILFKATGTGCDDTFIGFITFA